MMFPAKMLGLYDLDELSLMPEFMQMLRDGTWFLADDNPPRLTDGNHLARAKNFMMGAPFRSTTFPYHYLTSADNNDAARMQRFDAAANPEATNAAYNTYDDAQGPRYYEDFSDLAFQDKMTSLKLEAIEGPHVKKQALRIYMLRKVIQYSMGMDLAYVLCSEPLSTILPDATAPAGRPVAPGRVDCHHQRTVGVLGRRGPVGERQRGGGLAQQQRHSL